MVVSSILVHINDTSAQSGYAEFQTGSDSICTPEMEYVSNEIMYSEDFQVKLEPQDFDKKLKINVYSDRNHSHSGNIFTYFSIFRYFKVQTETDKVQENNGS